MRSLNLYVSQQQTTGTPAPFDIIATVALPALENMAPLDNMAAAPRSVSDTLESTEPMEERRTYVHGISAANNDRRRFLPSCIGRESTMMTENRLPCSLAARRTPSTNEDLVRHGAQRHRGSPDLCNTYLPKVRITSSSLILLSARSSTTLPAKTIRSRMKWSIRSQRSSRAY